MTKTHTDTLNGLLRGELAATETYQQALAQVHDEPGAADLRQIHVEHREAANTLRQHVHHVGGKPDQGSGAWGGFAKFVEGTAKLFGDANALRALKQGEVSGINSYTDALEDNDLPVECRTLISSQLLPQTREHAATLDRLLSAM